MRSSETESASAPTEYLEYTAPEFPPAMLAALATESGELTAEEWQTVNENLPALYEEIQVMSDDDVVLEDKVVSAKIWFIQDLAREIFMERVKQRQGKFDATTAPEAAKQAVESAKALADALELDDV